MKSTFIFLLLTIFFILLFLTSAGGEILCADNINHITDSLEAEKTPGHNQDPAEPFPVPEPATMFLLGTGLLVFAAFKSKMSEYKKERNREK